MTVEDHEILVVKASGPVMVSVLVRQAAPHLLLWNI